jgi:hypothetical protein
MADITRYLSLITSEHSDKPRFRSMLTAVLDKIDIGVDVDKAFDLDNAVGIQLDILGQILGLSRYLTFQPSDGTSSVLSDGDYRSLLKAKIILNQWNGELDTLTDAIQKWNPSVYFVVKDNQDMTVDILAIGTNELQKELISNGYVVPKPAGVKINYSMSTLAVFTYDSDTATLTGYDTGSWI